MAEYLNFSRGKSENLNKLTTFKVGTIYVCTDNGELYLAIADSTTDSDAIESTTETLLELTGEDYGESSDTLIWSEWPHNRDVYTPETYTFSGTYHSSNFHNGLKSLNNPKLLWNQEIEIETGDSMVVDGLPNIDRFKLSIDLRNDKYYITFYEPGSDDESEFGTYKYSFTDDTVPSLTFNTDSISIVSDYVRPIFENYFTISEPQVQEVPVLTIDLDEGKVRWSETIDTSNYEFLFHGEHTLYASDFADTDDRSFTIQQLISYQDYSWVFPSETEGCSVQIRSISSINSDIHSEWSNTVYLKQDGYSDIWVDTTDGVMISFSDDTHLSRVVVNNTSYSDENIENPCISYTIPYSAFPESGSYDIYVYYLLGDSTTLYHRMTSSPQLIEYVYESNVRQLNTNYDESQHKEDGTNYYVYNSGENTTLYLYIRDDEYDADCIVFTDESLIGTSFDGMSANADSDSVTLGDDSICIRINCDSCDVGIYQSFNITQNTTFYVLPAYYTSDISGTFEFGIYTYDPASDPQ